MWRSVPQMDVASTRTIACPGAGSGTGVSSSRSPGPASALMRASIFFTKIMIHQPEGDSGVRDSGDERPLVPAVTYATIGSEQTEHRIRLDQLARLVEQVHHHRARADA